MKKKGLYTVVLLLVSAIGLHAQEHVDTTVIRPHPAQMNVPLELVLPVIPLPALEQPESKEEQAARINKETYLRVMASVNQSHLNRRIYPTPRRRCCLSAVYSLQVLISFGTELSLS